MPPRTKAAGDTPRFDPMARYRVQLTRVVEYPPGTGRYLHPGVDGLELSGRAAAVVADAIGEASPVPPSGG